jgi:hypothetical protein
LEFPKCFCKRLEANKHFSRDTKRTSKLHYVRDVLNYSGFAGIVECGRRGNKNSLRSWVFVVAARADAQSRIRSSVAATNSNVSQDCYHALEHIRLQIDAAGPLASEARRRQ